MYRYIFLIIAGIVLIGGGVAYRKFLLPQKSVPVAAPVASGNIREIKVREITITAKKDQWKFDPEVIDVERGDKIIATVVNEDSYDHGIALDAFGVSRRIPAQSAIKIEFTATREGDYPFYCSVPCGQGVVEGVRRGHFDMKGKLHVRSAVSETK